MMIFSGLKWKITAILIGGLFIFGCERADVIATVNGEAITEKDINVLMRHAGMKEGAKIMPEGNIHEGMRQDIINQIINERLILQAAKKENIKVDKIEIMGTYSGMLRAFPNEADYLKRLKNRKLTKGMILKSIENSLTIEKFKERLSVNLSVSDTELKDYYDKHLQNFTIQEQLRLSLIKVDSLKKAMEIKREIERGINFEEMANKYPAGHTEPAKGQTDWLTLDTFPSDMAKEIRKIKAGTFGGPIKGREGYYLIKVHEKREKGVQPLDVVKDSIQQALMRHKKSERLDSWLQEARGQAKIEIMSQKK